ncbi:MAG TPA: hypothetical protein VE934_06435 [Polaromonas sp.]|uniref:hypothetical protein n=1 Tax=Polaromonas sp. TaxID=1869339 RepID=UPI002D2CDFB3|nr:hypothetical protein [Polaromonas sp.]HYW56576.1 hypothetical protein [Polaromonas sp.]
MGLKISRKEPATASKSPLSVPAENVDSRPHTIDDNSDNGTRRQLVQVVLRDCLRDLGIPPKWVECQMLLVNSRSRGPGMYVRLVVRQWDAQLLTYMVAFQKQLLAAITEFEPTASNWLHGISWEFNVGETCPYPDMPDPSAWVASGGGPKGAAKSAANDKDPAEDEVLKDLQDLQRMFAHGDAATGQQVDRDGRPVDFQNTQPAQM